MYIYSAAYSELLISKGILTSNYAKLREYIGGDFISVVKANAYGLGVKHIAKVLFEAGQNNFAVANLAEGIVLRKLLGESPKIFILGSVDIRDFHIANKFNLIIPIISLEYFKQFCNAKLKANKVYLQVDTGMNRLGVKCSKSAINGVIAYFVDCNMEFFGVFSHFALGDNKYISRKQISKLNGLNIPHLSFSASSATAKDYKIDETKRIGLAMFGYGTLADKLGLKTIASLQTKIIRLEEAKAHERVGYNRYYIDKDCYLATIPLGYADGLKRSYLGQNVKIGKKLYPIISICMDMAIVKVDRAVKLSDKVIIFDNNLSLERLAKADKTIVYECLTSLGDRIQRKIYQ